MQGVEVVQDAVQAAEALFELLENAQKAQALNVAAQAIMQKNMGSLQKHVQVIDQYL